MRVCVVEMPFGGKPAPFHLTWITLRVIHITTTTAATDSLRTLKTKTKDGAIYRKFLTLLFCNINF